MHEFFEESLDLENTFEYILSIQVSLNGFSFSILCTKENRVLAFKFTPVKISNKALLSRRFKEWYQTEEILHKAYKRTRLIVFSNKFTLIPEYLYTASTKEEVAHMLFQEGGKLKFAENIVESLKAKLLFSLPEGLMGILTETVGECEIIHPVKPLINALLCDDEDEDRVSLLFNNKELYLLVRKQNEMQLANSFRINHCNDAVYYILASLKQLGLSPKQMSVHYAGISPFKEETEKNLQNYFASIHKLSRPVGNLPVELINQNISLFY